MLLSLSFSLSPPIRFFVSHLVRRGNAAYLPFIERERGKEIQVHPRSRACRRSDAPMAISLEAVFPFFLFPIFFLFLSATYSDVATPRSTGGNPVGAELQLIKKLNAAR